VSACSFLVGIDDGVDRIPGPNESRSFTGECFGEFLKRWPPDALDRHRCSLMTKQCRRSHWLVSLAHNVHGARRHRALAEESHYSVAIREFALLNRIERRAANSILDVDHHARACWWSTSESSEKCPRVMRGKTNVPSEISISSDLIGICSEFVDALTGSVVRMVFTSGSARFDERRVLGEDYDLMSAVKTTMLER
jgi:hypothetical protein